MPECDCCHEVVFDLPYSHISQDPPHHQTDYCESCYGRGCDLETCSRPQHFASAPEFTDNDMAEVLKSFGLEGTA